MPLALVLALDTWVLPQSARLRGWGWGWAWEWGLISGRGALKALTEACQVTNTHTKLLNVPQGRALFSEGTRKRTGLGNLRSNWFKLTI